MCLLWLVFLALTCACSKAGNLTCLFHACSCSGQQDEDLQEDVNSELLCNCEFSLAYGECCREGGSGSSVKDVRGAGMIIEGIRMLSRGCEVCTEGSC